MMEDRLSVVTLALAGEGGGGGGGSVPIATPSTAGKVKPDDVTIKVDAQGTISAQTATGESLGVVQPDGETITIDDGVISVVSGASLSANVTANVAVGGINSGQTLAEGTTFTQFAQKLLIKETAPTVSFSASGSGVKEVGTSVTPTLTLSISDLGTGTPVSIAFYSGSTLLDTQTYVEGTSSYSYTMESAITDTTTVKGVLTYTKSDATSATIEKSASYTFVMASYYGAVTTAPTDKAGIIALTKSVKNTKSLTTTFTLSNQRSCYCYPASFGNLSSIVDGNGFQYITSYTKTNVTVDEVSYNVYTLTDPVTASGFKQVYS